MEAFEMSTYREVTLFNNYEKINLCFRTFEKARDYFSDWDVDDDEADEDYLDYLEEIRAAKDEKELIELVNSKADVYGNGSQWLIKSIDEVNYLMAHSCRSKSDINHYCDWSFFTDDEQGAKDFVDYCGEDVEPEIVAKLWKRLERVGDYRVDFWL